MREFVFVGMQLGKHTEHDQPSHKKEWRRLTQHIAEIIRLLSTQSHITKTTANWLPEYRAVRRDVRTASSRCSTPGKANLYYSSLRCSGYRQVDPQYTSQAQHSSTGFSSKLAETPSRICAYLDNESHLPMRGVWICNTSCRTASFDVTDRIFVLLPAVSKIIFLQKIKSKYWDGQWSRF